MTTVIASYQIQGHQAASSEAAEKLREALEASIIGNAVALEMISSWSETSAFSAIGNFTEIQVRAHLSSDARIVPTESLIRNIKLRTGMDVIIQIQE